MGITTRKVANGAKRYDVRVRHGGQVYFEGGFRTWDAAREALARLMKRALAEKYGMAATPPPKPWDPTVAELLGSPDAPEAGSYLDWLAMPGNRAPSHVRRVKTAVRALLPLIGSRRVSELTSDVVADYQRTRQSMPLRLGEANRAAAAARREALGLPPLPPRPSEVARTAGPACINRELSVLKAALAWATDPSRDPARRLERNPLAKLPVLREPEPRNPTLTIEDQVRLLDACSPRWLRDLVELMVATGLRPGEALALRWSDLNPDQGLLVVRHAKTIRSRLVPVPGEVLAELLARRPSDADREDLVFQSRNGRRISVEKAGHHFKGACVRAGLAGLTLHCLRHVFASRLLSAGASLPQVASVLGHRSLHATTRYAHPRLADLAALVEAVAAKARPSFRIVEGRTK